jgi:predicted RNase H-like HicB family nuclease
MSEAQLVTEKHPDGFVSYAVGLEGVVVAQGDSFEDSLADLESAIRFHTETFGSETTENRD